MSVYYKFKAWKDAATISFDGTGISVWDLKKEIIQANNLLPVAKEFDLHIYNSQNSEEYKNDHTIIPRGTSVTAQRLPARKSGLGTAVRYVTSESHAANLASQVSQPGQYNSTRHNQHHHSMSKRFDGRDEPVRKLNPLSDKPASALADVDNDEAAKIDAMFEQSGQQWEQAQQQMANARKIYNNPRTANGGRTTNTNMQSQQMPRKPPHSGYVCYRCGQPGHWIQDCPTLEDQSYDNIRIRRTTGIPKSFLQSVEGPTDDNKKNLMLGSDGGFVIARPDSASWAQHRQLVPKNLSAADVQGLQPEDPDLTCPIDNKLLKDAVKTPCCSTSFCKDCITKYLKTHSFVCSECESKVRSLDALKPDEDRRKRVLEYVDEIVRASKENAQEEEKEKEKEHERAAQAEAEGAQADNPPMKVAGVEQASQQAESNVQSAPDLAIENGNKAATPDASDSPKGSAADVEASRSTSPSVRSLPGSPRMDQDDNVNFSNNGNMPPMMMNPFMAQMQQLMMMLSNPALPPPARMQMQMQLNQMQTMMAMMTAQQQQQAFRNGPPPKAPRGPRNQYQSSSGNYPNYLNTGNRNTSARQSPFYPDRSSVSGNGVGSKRSRDRGEEEGEISDDYTDPKRSKVDQV